MGRAKALTKEEMEFYRELLLTLRERISGQLEHFTNEAQHRNGGDDSDGSAGGNHEVTDDADRASDEYDIGLTMQLASKEKHIIQDIDWALKKINDGTYGICEELGVPINRERLKAMPYAKLSREAQEEEEKRQKRG